jgi:hypothetical protein
MINIENLIQRALENQAQEMKEKEIRDFLIKHFPELSPNDVEELARPIPPGRRIPLKRKRLVGRVARRLEVQVREMKVDDREDFLVIKLPALSFKERDELITELTRPIPPRRKSGKEKKSGDKIIDFTDEVREIEEADEAWDDANDTDISPTGARPIPPHRD